MCAESKHGYDFNDGTSGIIKAAIEAHRELGPGFQEVVYQRALALELQAAGIEFTREVNVPVFYKGKQIDTRRVDFVVSDVIVEIKAKKEFAPEDKIQTLNYLRSSGYRVAILLNFGAHSLEIKRFVNDRNPRSQISR